MNDQEAFEIAVTGLIKQGRRSYRESGELDEPANGCMYRLDDGKGTQKCHVGWIIPDAKYKPEFEGQSAGEVCQCQRIPELADLNRAILSECQEAHDKADGKDFITQYLNGGGGIDADSMGIREIAADHGLDASFIDKVLIEVGRQDLVKGAAA